MGHCSFLMPLWTYYSEFYGRSCLKTISKASEQTDVIRIIISVIKINREYAKNNC